MAGPRPVWKGALQIRRVTIPIKVFPATETTPGIHLRQLHTTCHTPITQPRRCEPCKCAVSGDQTEKAYEYEKDRFVVLTAEELDAIAPPSTRVVDLVQFVPAAALEHRMIDRAYFLAPDGADGGPACQAYAVFTDAMRGAVGIGKLAIYGREYLVAVAPRDRGLLLYTLHHAAELRPAPYVPRDAKHDDVPPWIAPPKALVKAARQVIDAMDRPLDLEDFTDAYQADLRRLIDAKVAGEEIATPTAVEPPAIVNLKDALLASLKLRTPTRARAS